MKHWWCGRFQRWGLFPCELREYLKLTSEPCSALLGPQLKAGWPAPNYNGCVAAWGNEERPGRPEGHDFHPLSVHLWCSAPLIARQGHLWGISAITQTFPLGPQRRVDASAVPQESLVMSEFSHWSGQDKTPGLILTRMFMRAVAHWRATVSACEKYIVPKQRHVKTSLTVFYDEGLLGVLLVCKLFVYRYWFPLKHINTIKTLLFDYTNYSWFFFRFCPVCSTKSRWQCSVQMFGLPFGDARFSFGLYNILFVYFNYKFGNILLLCFWHLVCTNSLSFGK